MSDIRNDDVSITLAYFKNEAEKKLQDEINLKRVLQTKIENFVESGTYEELDSLQPWFDDVVKYKKLTEVQRNSIITRAVRNKDTKLFGHFSGKCIHIQENFEADRKRYGNSPKSRQEEQLQQDILKWLLSLNDFDEMKNLVPFIGFRYVIVNALKHYMESDQYDRFCAIILKWKHIYVSYFSGDVSIDEDKYYNTSHMEYVLKHNDLEIAHILKSNQVSVPRSFRLLETNESTKEWINSQSSYSCIIC